MTKFAVATVKQAKDLVEARRGYSALIDVSPYWRKGWIGVGLKLTDAGWMALELREALGPDRNLSVAGAKALLGWAPTRATRTRLVEDGLRKRSFVIGQESTLTEDGERVKAILIKYQAEF